MRLAVPTPRLSATFGALSAAALLGACTPPPPAASPTVAAAPEVRVEEVRQALYTLAADSMEGRGTATPGMWRAARYLAERFRAAGLEPAGDDGFYQRLPIALETAQDGRVRRRLLASWADTTAVPADRRRIGVNVVGVLRGSDPALRDEAVVVGAHYDHLGIGRAVDGDSIYNGADDDGSGTIAVLEAARMLAAGPRPKRTIVFLLTTGEEVGLLGTHWYIANPVIPLARTVADLQVEMIGRPDSLAGGPGRAWLTGFERSTMGEALAAEGIAIVQDPRPAMGFFERSDNIAFAWKGIPAHTISSYNMHRDYHTPNDEPDRIDYDHMTAVVRATVRAVRVIADGPRPEWKPGGRPEPRQ